MTWDIVVGLITLVGAFVSVGTIVYKLSRIMSRLETTMQALDGTLQELKANNTENHKFIHQRIDKHDDEINDHECRITVLEHNK